MRNQPKYNFLKNTTYALKGLKDLILTETSFKIELFLAVILISIVIYIDFSMTNKILMFMSLMAMLIAEAINSAIERVVDLITLDYHKMAERAKDVGSAIVFLSILLFIVVWSAVFYNEFLSMYL
jgi:diacylglycerol kinase (ATP)